jgi:hypothetical protein
MTELPFNTIEFAEAWQDWLEYKEQEFKFKYKSTHSMKAALKKLNRLAGGNEQKAIAIIEESMANGWKGFFSLKDIEVKEPTTLAGQMMQKYGIGN